MRRLGGSTLAAVALAALLLGTGCGGGDDDAEEPTESATETPGAAGPTATTVANAGPATGGVLVESAQQPVDIDLATFEPEATNFRVALGVDASGQPVDVVESVPYGVESFFLFFDYTGMIDGAAFSYDCFYNSETIGFDQTYSRLVEPDYRIWSLGDSGTTYAECTTDGLSRGGSDLTGSPLPAGTYDVPFLFGSDPDGPVSAGVNGIVAGSFQVTVAR